MKGLRGGRGFFGKRNFWIATHKRERAAKNGCAEKELSCLWGSRRTFYTTDAKVLPPPVGRERGTLEKSFCRSHRN